MSEDVLCMYQLLKKFNTLIRIAIWKVNQHWFSCAPLADNWIEGDVRKFAPGPDEVEGPALPITKNDDSDDSDTDCEDDEGSILSRTSNSQEKIDLNLDEKEKVNTEKSEQVDTGNGSKAKEAVSCTFLSSQSAYSILRSLPVLIQ